MSDKSNPNRTNPLNSHNGTIPVIPVGWHGSVMTATWISLNLLTALFFLHCSCTALVGEHGFPVYDWPNDLWPHEAAGPACSGSAGAHWESCTCIHRYWLCHSTQAVVLLLRVKEQVLHKFRHFFSSLVIAERVYFSNPTHLFKYVTLWHMANMYNY